MVKKFYLITPPSLFIGAALYLLRRRKLYEEKSEEAFARQLSDASAAGRQPFAAPKKHFGCPIRTTRFDGMQVLLINEKPEKPDRNLILYFHGGGFLYPPGKLQLHMICVLAKRTDACVVVPLYPRLPDANCKAALDTLSAFYRQFSLFQTAKSVSFAGDSAGGALAVGFAMLLRDEKRPMPAKIALFSPWLDLSVSAPEIEKLSKRDPVLAPWGLKKLGALWADGEAGLKNPYFSPLCGNVSGLPDIAVFTGTREILYPDAVAFCEKLDSCDADFRMFTYVGMHHVFSCYITPEGMLSRARAARFLR